MRARMRSAARDYLDGGGILCLWAFGEFAEALMGAGKARTLTDRLIRAQNARLMRRVG